MKRVLNTCLALLATSWVAIAAAPQTTPQKEKRPEPPPAAQKEKTRPHPEKAQPPEGAQPKTQRTAPALTPDQRAIAKKAAHFERIHRERQARMDRLIRIFKAKGNDAKVAKLEEMKLKEDKRTANALAGFRQKLGEEHWNKLDAEMKRRRPERK